MCLGVLQLTQGNKATLKDALACSSALSLTLNTIKPMKKIIDILQSFPNCLYIKQTYFHILIHKASVIIIHRPGLEGS